MKKILILLFVVVAASSVKAQFYVGGTASLFSDKAKGSDAELSYSIMPEIGYNLSENWAVGAVVGYEKNSFKTFQFAPYARYTFLKSDLVNLFVDGSFGYVSTKADIDGAKSQDGFALQLTPGLSVNLSKNLSLVAKYAALGYKKYTDESSRFGLGVNGNDLSFGLYYTF